MPSLFIDAMMFLNMSIDFICCSECEITAVMYSITHSIDVAGDDKVNPNPWWLPGATLPGMVTPSMPPNSTIKSASGAGWPQTICIVSPSAMLPARSSPLRKSKCAVPDLSSESWAMLLSEMTSGNKNMALAGKTASRITSHKAWGKNKIHITMNTHMGTYIHVLRKG